jgi:hypothetical protein
MGIDPLEKEWGELKVTNRDTEYVKRIKLVYSMFVEIRLMCSFARNYERQVTLNNNSDSTYGIGIAII